MDVGVSPSPLFSKQKLRQSCSEYSSQEREIIFLYVSKRLIFVMDMNSVPCAEGTKFLYII